MELKKKLSVGSSNGDMPEDKLLDILKAVQMKIEDVAFQCDQIDEDNETLAKELEKELQKQENYKEKISSQTEQLQKAKQESNNLNRLAAEKKMQLNHINDEMVFFQGQANQLKTVL